MLPLHERLREVMVSYNQGLLSEAEYTEAKRLLVQESCSLTEDGGAAPKAPKRPPPASAAETAADDARDLFPLPFAPKTGATARQDVAYQKFYNLQMWEVYRAHPQHTAKDRACEVRRRWGMQQGLEALRADVNAAVRLAKKGLVGQRYDDAALHALIERCARTKREFEEAHDQAVTRVLHMLPAQLVGPPNERFDRKPHLFKMLRTAEVASIDSAWLGCLAQGSSLALFLHQKASWAYSVSVGLEQRGADTALPAPPPGNPAAPPQCLLLNAWKKFARAAAKEFQEVELRLVSHDTLQTLLAHYGSSLTRTEQYWVGLQWRAYQKEPAAAATPRRAAKPPLQNPPTPPASTQMASQLASTQMASQLDTVRQLVATEEYKRQATAPLRQDYEEALQLILQENASLIEERNAQDESLVKELTRNVKDECEAAYQPERAQHVAEIVRLNNELTAVRGAHAAALQEREAEIWRQARQAAAHDVADELAEAQRLREQYEEQVGVLRAHLSVCSEQNSLLSTELQGKPPAVKLVADLRGEWEKEADSKLHARTADLQGEVARQGDVIASLTIQLEAQTQAAEASAEAQQLYRECLLEMKRTLLMHQHGVERGAAPLGQRLAQHLDDMQVLNEITGRAASLSPAGRRRHPVSAAECGRAMSPPKPEASRRRLASPAAPRGGSPRPGDGNLLSPALPSAEAKALPPQSPRRAAGVVLSPGRLP
eukprot:TRINITY_DN5871_c0_g1_i1.p1 TRINITY_DN5871_c0_g1~~TRINITY_DN5871_c0_g1_i1.p1  ORF type:complete len:716 (+),score=253.55 TRINITY_DN5871_c0_g1_i1:96-2243(+)